MMTNEGTDMVMPVSPMYGNGGGFGNGFDGNGWWVLLLFLLIGNNGWGNGFNGGGSGSSLYPWMNQAEITTGGFRDQMINSNIDGIEQSINNLSTQICNGFANAEVADNARQIANMQQAFASQTATTQGFTNLASELAGCCCENRLATADLKYTIATENCADRYEAAQNTRDIIDSQTRSTQSILDKLCQLELDAKNDKIADLERQLTMANLAASQTAQTSRLLADNAAQTVALEQYLNPTPVPAYVVQNPNCCANNVCGCGCGSGF